MAYEFVNVNAFTPNLGQWTSIGNISTVTQNGNVFTLNMAQGGLALQVSILSETCFQVRFNPMPGTNYSVENFYAVVNRNLGPVTVTVTENTSSVLKLDTGQIQIQINLQPYQILVYRNGQLINADMPGYNLVYIPGQSVRTCFGTRLAMT